MRPPRVGHNGCRGLCETPKYPYEWKANIHRRVPPDPHTGKHIPAGTFGPWVSCSVCDKWVLLLDAPAPPAKRVLCPCCRCQFARAPRTARVAASQRKKKRMAADAAEQLHRQAMGAALQVEDGIP